jgi:DNA polymerase III subunit gamma/tau
MNNNNHKVLALKYRPRNFDELIGQDIMVQTVTNSIKLDKIPNAYLLTGIRGVGKTTTARLIAKALNCTKNFIAQKSGENCKCNNCDQISNSKHLDVLEMDAASRTGIDDVRELIESSKYNPTSAKYKIFIIDEVHMLSKQAFNGLLKTLEEPPSHLKFIFATTEVRKIPVTIISRCQRFDLHRVPIKILLEKLKKISEVEGGNISEDALKLIAKASEGSVRDSLSLLDRALIGQHIIEREIDETFIRQMLGIADRSKILQFLNFIFEGDQKQSIKSLRTLINEGLEPASFLNDLLEVIYFIIQKKSIGNFESDLSISESELETIDKISKDVEKSTLVLFWQFILKAIEELSIVANQILSLEMLVVRLIHLKEIPSYETLLDSVKKKNSDDLFINKNIIDNKNDNLIEKSESKKKSQDQIKNVIQEKPELTSLIKKDIEKENLETISSFEDLIKISSEKREIELKYELEKNVNLIKFEQGKIDIAFNENLGKNFVRNLSEKLVSWTGKRWLITLTKGIGEKSFAETQLIKKKETFEKEKNSEVYKKFKDIFVDGNLVEVKKKD